MSPLNLVVTGCDIAITHSQQEAIDRVKQITHNLGGGEVRIQNRHGKFRDGEREK